MQTAPAITIGLPVYNAERFLADARLRGAEQCFLEVRVSNRAAIAQLILDSDLGPRTNGRSRLGEKHAEWDVAPVDLLLKPDELDRLRQPSTFS